MGNRFHYTLLAALIVLGTGLASTGWWLYRPAYERNRMVALAEKKLEADQSAQAEEILRELIKSAPEDFHLQFLYAQALRRLGRSAEARVALLRAGQLGLPQADGRREYALLEAGVNFPLAESTLGQVLEERPDDVEIMAALADGYSRAGRWRKAEPVYARLLQLQPGLDLLVQRGRMFMEAGQYDRAIADFRAVIKESPKHFDARLLLSHCLLSQARMTEAEEELLYCRKLQPARVEPLVGLATCAEEKGDLQQATTLIRQALALDPTSILALHVQGNLYMRKQQYEPAISVYQKILAANSRDKQAHLKLGQALSQVGRIEEAKRHEEAFQQLDREEESRSRKLHGM
jgi:tetratricopeptide (TPR) repeat protein